MTCKTRIARTMTLACTAALAGCVNPPEIPPVAGLISAPPGASATVPVLFDDNRMFVDLAFVRPDGSVRKARAFVNMGAIGLVLDYPLYRELGADKDNTVTMRLGDMPVRIDARAIQTVQQSSNFTIQLNPFHRRAEHAPAPPPPPGEEDPMAALSGPLHVEAELPSGVLQTFVVVADYGARTLTFATPGTIAPQGIAVPFRLNPKTGFMTVDLVIDGQKHAMVIDDGGFRREAAGDLISAHPDWVISDTAIGEANLTMDGSGLDANSPVLRLPRADIGALHLEKIGVAGLGMGSFFGRVIGGWFWDYYSTKAGERVDGWIAGNVLKGYRITLDYAHRMSYWLKQSDLDPHDLDQVGVTLEHAQGGYAIAAIATKNGQPSVPGVQVGDIVVRIDGLVTATATHGQILTALHGKPGDTHALEIERDGKSRSIQASVTAF
jgi:hypothetical protein